MIIAGINTRYVVLGMSEMKLCLHDKMIYDVDSFVHSLYVCGGPRDAGLDPRAVIVFLIVNKKAIHVLIKILFALDPKVSKCQQFAIKANNIRNGGLSINGRKFSQDLFVCFLRLHAQTTEQIVIKLSKHFFKPK